MKNIAENIWYKRWLNNLQKNDYILIDDGNTRYKAKYLGFTGGDQYMVDAEYAKVETVERWMMFPVFPDWMKTNS